MSNDIDKFSKLLTPVCIQSKCARAMRGAIKGGGLYAYTFATRASIRSSDHECSQREFSTMTKTKRFGVVAALAFLIPATTVQADSLLGIGNTGPNSSNYIDTINPQTGATTVVNAVDGVGYSAPTFVVSGTNAYVISGNALFDVNTSIGAVVSVVSLPVGFGALAVSNGSLLGFGSSGLYTINSQTGAATVLNSNAGGMAYSAPTFVASGTNAYVISNNVLYDYNTNTGALLSALLVGSFQSLAVSGSSLLGIASNGSIDTINPQTGVVTVLNSEAFGSGFWQANGFVATTTDAYALSAGNVLYDFNTSTGALNSAVDLGTGFGALALPTPPETPLPAALPLFATGLGAIGLVGWRRRRKSVADIAA